MNKFKNEVNTCVIFLDNITTGLNSLEQMKLFLEDSNSEQEVKDLLKGKLKGMLPSLIPTFQALNNLVNPTQQE